MRLTNSGYSATAVVEIVEAITVLMNYGLISSKVPSQNENMLSNNSSATLMSGNMEIEFKRGGSFEHDRYSYYNDHQYNNQSYFNDYRQQISQNNVLPNNQASFMHNAPNFYQQNGNSSNNLMSNANSNSKFNVKKTKK